MTKGEHSFVQHIQTLFDSGTIGELTDRQLLKRFADRHDETAEPCFAVLIKRHGPMVFRTCNAILHDRHEAEDAFQATFLVLARKAGSLWIRDSLGPWLLEVSCRVASRARYAALRRRIHEREAAKTAAATVEDTSWDDRGAVLCEELTRLPDGYRAAVVLCDLEGLTQEKAARLLGWPAGTVRSRLARGRQRLRDRLTLRGLAPSVVPVGAWLAREATPATVPAALSEITVHGALQVVGGRAVIGTMSSACALTKGVLSIMFWSKLKPIAAVILAGGLFAGTALLGHWAVGLHQGRSAAPEPKPPPKDHAGVQTGPAAPAPPSPHPLSPTAKARLDVAKKLRDANFRLWQGGEIGLTEYLSAQRRFDDVVDDVMVKSDADRVRFLEHQVTALKRNEQLVRKLFDDGQARQTDVFIIELYRLEAEDKLEKAMAKIEASGAASGDTGSSQLMELLNPELRPATAPAPPATPPLRDRQPPQ